MTNHKAIVQRLEEVMKDSKTKSIRAFALSINVDPSLLSKVLAGQRNISESIADAVCKTYNVNKDWLLYSEGEKYGQNEDNRGSNGSISKDLQQIIFDLRSDKAELREDKKVLQRVIETNLTALMQLLTALSLHDRAWHEIIVRALARLENKTEDQLIGEARTLEAAKTLQAHGKGSHKTVDK